MRGHRYTPEQINFLAANVTGRSRFELIEMFNKRFNLQVTYKSIDKALYKNDLRSRKSRKGKKIFYLEHVAYLSENVSGRSHKALTDMFNEHFNMQLSVKQISHALRHNGLHNGLRGKNNKNVFKKGHYYGNGRNGKKIKKSKSSYECKRKPIGFERPNRGSKDDSILVKVADPNVWVRKQILIWETANGSIPEGHVIVFGDGNNRNFDLDNLLLVPRRLMAIINRYKLIGAHADITKVGIATAEMIYTINKIKRENRKSKKYLIRK